MSRNHIAMGFVLLLAIVMVAGFWLIGSPQTNRERQLDQENINRASRIFMAIYYDYCRRHQSLPPKFDDIPLSKNEPRTDAHTGQDFGYRPLGKTSFELCATFKHPPEGNEIPPCVNVSTIYDRDNLNDICNYQPGYHCYAIQVQECGNKK